MDDFDLEVADAWFGEDEEADGDRIYLFLRGPAVSDDDEEEEYRERFGTGKNWEAVEGGAVAEKATGKNNFDKRSGVGRLIRSFAELGDDVVDALVDRGDANEASTYVGLTIHFVREVVSTWTDDDGDKVEWEMPLATAVTFPKKKKKKKSGGSGN